MAEPTRKSKAIENALTQMTGQDRRQVIRSDMCMAAPYGCGGPATDFTDELSAREYRISGLCQSCQDGIFGPDRTPPE